MPLRVHIRQLLRPITRVKVSCMYAYTCMYIIGYAWMYVPGLKPGRVTQVIRVTFSPGQAGLTRIIKYPGLTRILHCITCIDNGGLAVIKMMNLACLMVTMTMKAHILNIF